MPIQKSAYKDLRKAKKRTAKNAKIKENIKFLLKKTSKSVENKEKDAAQETFLKAVKAIDKAMQKKLIKKNTGARKKSRLAKKVNALK
jgi:small subunit ribosomal protein S20